jgi:uncharacterized iron-regulated protein
MDMKTSLLPLLGLLCACAMPPPTGAKLPVDAACMAPGAWFDPATGETLAFPGLIDRFAERPVVLLGESHASAEDHRWQLQVLAALFARNPDLTIGFEAFPRRLQPVLDRWVSGKLSRKQFLADSEWEDVWGFPPDLYMPIFHFARMNRIPMLALNVDRSLVARVGKEGWDAIPVDERQGIGSPDAPSTEYRESLGRVFAQHRSPKDADTEEGKNGDNPESAPPTLADPNDPAFARFVDAQLTWDRAMAEAIATARNEDKSRQVVGIIGRGHVDYGYGVAHQLAGLGIEDTALLATWSTDRDCADLVSEAGIPVANALFAVAADEVTHPGGKPRGPRLGVLLSETEAGVRIDGVVEKSVAEQAGIRKGDIVRQAAGREIAKSIDLAKIIRATPYGTWLPISIERDKERLDLVAKFPARPHPPMDGPSPHRKGSADDGEKAD